MRSYSCRRAAVAASFVATSVLSIAAYAQSVVKLDLPAQPLADSLREFGFASNTNIIFDPSLVVGITAPAIRVSATAEQALTRLLTGTQLRFKFVDEKTVSLMLATEKATSVTKPLGKGEEGNTAALNLAQAASATMSAADAQGTEQVEDPSKVSAGASGKAIEEIVVTAQKREERLQDVPISITVLNGEDLDRSTAPGVGELLNRVPGVVFDNAIGSIAGGNNLAMRGVTAPSSYVAGPSPVAYYIDSVPFGLVRSSLVPDAQPYDLDRVEVLRGPQGTLYGSSAQAGVVRVLTKDAALDAWEFKTRGLLSHTDKGGANSALDAAVNVPLVDGKLAARAAVSYKDFSGWIDKATRADANDLEQLDARVKIKAEPTDNLSLGFSAWLSRADNGALPTATDGEGKFSAYADVEWLDADFDTYGVTVGYDFPSFSLVSMTSYLDYVSDSAVKHNAARTRSFVRAEMSAEIFSQEFSLSSTTEGPWRWTAGAMYRNGEDRQYLDLYLVSYPSSVKYTSESWAAFGELTRQFLGGELELTAGLRYFSDTVGQVHESNFGNDPSSPAALAPDAEDEFSKTTPRVILNWHPREQTTLYASYAQGFRSGLQQAPAIRVFLPDRAPLTKPDLLTNYEVGAKGTAWDGRVGYEAAIYYMDWKDVQLPLGVIVDAANNIGFGMLINGASASGIGSDTAVTFYPSDRFELGLNFSWNDLRVDEDVYSGGVRLFEAGDRLNSSIEMTGGVFATYSFPIGAGGLEGSLGVSGNGRTPLGSRGVSGTTVVYSEGASIVTGRADFTLSSSKGWRASLFVDNLSNEQDASVAAPSLVAGIIDYYYLRPRTYGLQLEYRL